MRTIEQTIYQFNELSESAKENVRQWIYEGLDYIGHEAGQTLDKFCDLFNIKYNSIDYEEPYRNEYNINIPDNAENLTGVRFATYIYNNYLESLYKGKCFSIWSKKEKSYKYSPKGQPVLKTKYSRWYKQIDCPFTGFYYDYQILQPLIDFCNKPNDNETLETLLDDCINNLCKTVQSEIEYTLKDDAIQEHCEANNYEFDENGEITY